LEYHGHTIVTMPARKVAISLSSEALALVDRDAAREGISRSAWFERAAQREKRRQGIKRALSLARATGVRAATDKELETLRKQLA
jgi:hypothetical protein